MLYEEGLDPIRHIEPLLSQLLSVPRNPVDLRVRRDLPGDDS